MKRELLENVKVQPYTSGDAIDREGYLSAVLGVSLGAATGCLFVVFAFSIVVNVFISRVINEIQLSVFLEH